MGGKVMKRVVFFVLLALFLASACATENPAKVQCEAAKDELLKALMIKESIRRTEVPRSIYGNVVTPRCCQCGQPIPRVPGVVPNCNTIQDGVNGYHKASRADGRVWSISQ